MELQTCRSLKSCLASGLFSYELKIQKNEPHKSCEMKWELLNRSSLQHPYIGPFLETPTILVLPSRIEKHILQIPGAMYCDQFSFLQSSFLKEALFPRMEGALLSIFSVKLLHSAACLDESLPIVGVFCFLFLKLQFNLSDVISRCRKQIFLSDQGNK